MRQMNSTTRGVHPSWAPPFLVPKLKKAEDKIMVYDKPEVKRVSSSLEAVQSQNVKVKVFLMEGPQSPYDATPHAYDADE
jgi:hypothetical protein